MKENYLFGFLFIAFLAEFFNGALAMNNSSIVNTTASYQITPTMSLNQSLTSSMMTSINQSLASSVMTSIKQSSATISPSPTSTTPQSSSTDTAQVNVGGSSDKLDFANIPLPPDNQRRDFDFVANTKMKWVPYLFDRESNEFVFMAKLIEKTFNELFSKVPGFVKTELSEFQQDKVTFILIIYTKKEADVTKAKLESPVGAYLQAGNDVFTIYQHEIKPRFQEMPPDTNIKPVYANEPTPKEKPNHFLNFMQGFGIAIGMVVVFTMIAVTKYKISQSCKSKDKSERESLKEGFDNEGLE